MSDLRAAGVDGRPPLAGWRISSGAVVNAVAGILVVAVIVVDLASSLGQHDGAPDWRTVVGVLVVVASCLTQVVAELALAHGRNANRHPVLAALSLLTGLGSAGLLYALGHGDRTTCSSYCDTDLVTGARIEVIAGAVAVYAVLTSARLHAAGRFRTGRVEAVIAVVAVGVPIAFTVTFVLGSH